MIQPIRYTPSVPEQMAHVLFISISIQMSHFILVNWSSLILRHILSIYFICTIFTWYLNFRHLFWDGGVVLILHVHKRSKCSWIVEHKRQTEPIWYVENFLFVHKRLWSHFQAMPMIWPPNRPLTNVNSFSMLQHAAVSDWWCFNV